MEVFRAPLQLKAFVNFTLQLMLTSAIIFRVCYSSLYTYSGNKNVKLTRSTINCYEICVRLTSGQANVHFSNSVASCSFWPRIWCVRNAFIMTNVIVTVSWCINIVGSQSNLPWFSVSRCRCPARLPANKSIMAAHLTHPLRRLLVTRRGKPYPRHELGHQLEQILTLETARGRKKKSGQHLDLSAQVMRLSGAYSSIIYRQRGSNDSRELVHASI